MKRECDPIVKSEKAFEEMPFVTEAVPRFGSKKFIENLQTEKETVIKELLSVKGESQRLQIQLYRCQKENADANRMMEEQKQQYLVQINSLTAELNVLKKQLENESTKTNAKAKIISHLMKDKSLLTAQLKQVQLNTGSIESTGKKPPTDSSTDSDEDGEYEVERILSHRMNKKQRSFFVRWKGYSQDHDCWVNEKDLHCPVVLNTYLKCQNLE